MIDTLLVSATKKEIFPFIQQADFRSTDGEKYLSEQYPGIQIFICGVGMMEAAVNLEHFLNGNMVKRILHVGLVGAAVENLKLLDLIVVKSEAYGDLGSRKYNIFDLGLKSLDEPPFRAGRLHASTLFLKLPAHLESVHSISVNSMESEIHVARLRAEKYNAAVEHMEGIGIFYVATKRTLPINSIRIVSNRAGDNDKSNWRIEEACNKLSAYLLQIL